MPNRVARLAIRRPRAFLRVHLQPSDDLIMQMDLLELNPGPSTCEADVIPLHHNPLIPEPTPSNLEHVRTFLQLAAELNIIVANITSPSNLFHFFRRQLAWQFRIPAVLMSPKSLLRNAEAVSPIEEFTTGNFKEVIADDEVTPKSVKRILLVSGKLYYELNERRKTEKRKDIAIIRLEQLHPFPYQQLQAEIDKYPAKAQIVFVQEEPQNMGYVRYVLHKMGNREFNLNAHELDVNEEQMSLSGRSVYYISRKPSASPATGFMKVHVKEQAELIDKAFNI